MSPDSRDPDQPSNGSPPPDETPSRGDPPPRGGRPPPEEEAPDADLSRTPSKGKGDDVAALIRTIEADAKAKERALKEHRARRRSRIWYMLLVFGILANGYLWIGQPTWLGLGGSAPTLAEEEGMLRYRMYVEARRIQAFQNERGAPPESLDELESSAQGLRYRRTGPATWELLGEEGRASLVLHSTDSLNEFLGVTVIPPAAASESGDGQP